MLTALILASTLTYTPEPFDKADYAFLGSLAVVSLFDVMSTEYGLHNTPGMSEGDPLLGPHPNRLRMYGGFVLAQAAVWGLAYVMPNPIRKIVEGIILGAETGNVISNFVTTCRAGYSIGYGFHVSF
jgi:hypothetical protein